MTDGYCGGGFGGMNSREEEQFLRHHETRKQRKEIKARFKAREREQRERDKQRKREETQERQQREPFL